MLALSTAAALLAAGCDTYGYNDPYGAPLPPPAPYPGEPYPPTGPYPPPAPYPPAGAYPPAPAPPPDAYPAGVCEGISSRNWRAWVTSGPARPTLFVSGTVTTPTAGYRVEFRPDLEELRSYPVQVFATLQPFPPVGPAAQVVTPHAVRWQWPLGSGPVGSVSIRCGQITLATIPVQSPG